ncbi:MAG: O-antigen ligase family protein [Clostridia bacterium]|nr:O-antigen ligase family protein [Clostridia bacterium]
MLKEFKTKDLQGKLKYILEKLSEIFIAIMIIIFPLCVDSTGFFKILECKYKYFLGISVTYISLNIIILLYFLIFYKINYFKQIKFSKIQIAVMLFWVINVISCLFSPYFNEYNLFIGVGRGEGLINITLYCFIFLFITLFGKFEKRYILYFSISSIILNTIAILQYIGFNPLNMYQDGIGTHNVSFMITIGNIAFISAMFCILLTVSVIAFIFLEEPKTHKIIHFLSAFMGFFIFIIINVLGGRVAFLGIVLLLFPFIITNSKRLSRAILIFVSILAGLLINIIINPEYHYNIGKLQLYFQFNGITFMFCIVCIVLVFLAYVLSKRNFDLSKNKKLIIGMYLSVILIGVMALTFVFFGNFESGILYEVNGLLHGNFDDTFGTYRVFLWRRAFTLLDEHALIGTGPDTFAIRFMDRYTDDVIALGEGQVSINDTAANVYITMLINIGIIGLISYLIFIFLQLQKGLKNKNSHSFVLLMAIVCYLIQDLFNLWVVIVTPIFWVLMAIHYLSIQDRRDDTKEKNYNK